MANIVKVKRSATPAKVPTTSDLALGEIAVNTYDGVMYIKKDNGTASIVQIGGGGGSGDVVGPSSATDNALARFDTTTGKLIQNSVVTIDDTGNEAGLLSQQFSNGSAVTLAAGKQWYDGTTGSWNLGMGGGNITQQVGEELFVYGKASSAINDSPLQIIYQTGTVGASGVVTFAPTTSGITDGNLIIGVATEPIALNGFGRINSFGIVHGITTNGSAYGETWADGDTIWYNPTTGNPTKNKPSAPNIKVQIGTIINAGSGGSGSFSVEINHGSVLGGTDSNVQITSVANNDLLQYYSAGGYWRNVATIGNSSLTNSSITINNSAISLGGSVSVGTVTSVSGTAPISVATGTSTPAISISQASSTTNGYLSSTDWNTFNNKTSNTGTVTSVAMTVPTGLSISGTPITTSGTLALTLTTGYSIPTTASQTNWNSAYTQRLQWDGGSTNLVAATGRTSLGGTTVGQNFFTLTNPSAITFPRMNADNTVSALDAATFRTAIGAGTSSTTGTVTSVAALTLGTTGTDLSSTVANGTTTPVITLNVPTASATNRGALSAADWTTFNNKTSNTGTVTSVAATAGTGISVTGSPITTSGTLTITNTAPDQVVAFTNGTGISVTGTYPNFTVTNTAPSSGGTVTSITAGTGLSGGTITSSGTISLANTTVTAGSYTNASITVDAQGRITAASSGSGSSGTVTSVSGTGTVNGLTLTGTVTTSGSLTLGGTLTIASKEIYDSFTATASQTTFTPSNTYTSGKIDVYANGIKMRNGSDVTVTSGTSVVFATGLAVGTLVDLVYPI